jgi:hypothetical protein
MYQVTFMYQVKRDLHPYCAWSWQVRVGLVELGIVTIMFDCGTPICLKNNMQGGQKEFFNDS